jgi:hypothetical protein
VPPTPICAPLIFRICLSSVVKAIAFLHLMLATRAPSPHARSLEMNETVINSMVTDDQQGVMSQA